MVRVPDTRGHYQTPTCRTMLVAFGIVTYHTQETKKDDLTIILLRYGRDSNPRPPA